MTVLEKTTWLNAWLLKQMPHYAQQAKGFGASLQEQSRLLRSLMNVYTPNKALPSEFISLQNDVLQYALAEKGIMHLESLIPLQNNSRLYLWQGDITRLGVDAIVNAANSAMLGCFIPCHACIDNAIHSAAGLQLRQECRSIMQRQNSEEQTGSAKITKAYNLPSKHVIHTVGPIISGELKQHDCELLKNCYTACLSLAAEHGLKSIAFCCISTGEFHFPNRAAAQIAIDATNEFLQRENSEMRVIFNVFKQLDHQIYRDLLGEYRQD